MADKPKIFTQRMRVKLVVTFLLLIVMFVGLMCRLTYINAESGKQYEKQVLSQQNYSSTTLPYARGEIQDRNGTPLATSVKVYNLILEPRNVIDADQYKDKSKKGETQKATVAALVKYFDLTADDLNTLIDEHPKSYYNIVLRKLSYEEVQPFKKFLLTKKGEKIKGVRFEEEYKRSYPNKTLASNVIGFTSSGNIGNWGVEQYYNSTLNGIDGREYGYLTDELKLERTVRQPVNGNNVVMTLDVNIQRIAEKRINNFMKKIGATGRVNALVMNPNNGEILAMASDNQYDLNDPFDDSLLKADYSDKEIKEMTSEKKLDAYNKRWRNPIIADTYEPGSTFKPFTIAAGLEEGILKGNETYNCKGSLQLKGWPKPIKCHSYAKGGDGLINLKQSLEQSCNVALMLINQKNGAKIFSRYQTLFGFGPKTGIDLPGEAATSPETTLMYAEEDLTSINLATNSFGQSFNCTMIQLGSAFCSLINGGYYYQPHIVKQIANNEGGVVKNVDKTLVKRTVSKATSDWMKDALHGVVENGTGEYAQIKGYTVGGKTGTAEKLPRNKGKYLVSFISFMPVEKPQVMVYVTIDEIKMSNQEQTRYAVTIARDILKDLTSYMNIPKSTSSTSTKSKKAATTEAATTENSSSEATTAATE